MIRVYKLKNALLIEDEGKYFVNEELTIDEIFLDQNIDPLEKALPVTKTRAQALIDSVLAPIQSQDIWAAGVTYYRSRDARMEESKKSGGGDFYDRVYDADRPELFFKSNNRWVRGPGEKIRIRQDSNWNVPEPELTLCVSPSGQIIGYTIGNDVSSRSIEGENPLYLPQAKSYDGCAALGPCILWTSDSLTSGTKIELTISRKGKKVYYGSTDLSLMKRKFSDLISYLFMECSFPRGCFLMTGTGIIPPDEFSLKSGDVVEIAIDQIGVLMNEVD